jgi:hypothetical protein
VQDGGVRVLWSTMDPPRRSVSRWRSTGDRSEFDDLIDT